METFFYIFSIFKYIQYYYLFIKCNNFSSFIFKFIYHIAYNISNLLVL